jgi:transcriptional regulator with XRE-family HTH domain
MSTTPAIQRTSTPRKHDVERISFKAAMLKVALSSAFQGVLKKKRNQSGLTLQSVAKAMGKNKSEVSRWFSRNPPNWQISTIAALADCLKVSVDFRLVDQETGEIFTPSISYFPNDVITTTAQMAFGGASFVSNRITPSADDLNISVSSKLGRDERERKSELVFG